MTAEIEIRNLLNRAAFLVDEGSPEELAALYCEDGVWESPTKVLHGRAAILGMMRGNHKTGSVGTGSLSRHLLTTLTVDIGPDAQTATAHAYWIVISTANAAPEIRMAGGYSYQLRKEQVGWRVAHRRVDFFGPDK